MNNTTTTATARTGTFTFTTNLLPEWEDSRNDNAGTAVKVHFDRSGMEIFYGLYSYENAEEFTLDLDGGYEIDAEGTRKYWGNVKNTEIFIGTLNELQTLLSEKFKLQS